MRIAPENGQRMLLEVPPTKAFMPGASARNLYGSFAQEVVCRALNLNPIPINGMFEMNLDAKLDETYFEIKSVRKGNKIVLYDWRMKKDHDCGLNIRYAIFVHDFSQLTTCESLLLHMHVNPKAFKIMLAPAELIRSMALEEKKVLPIIHPGKRHGHTREGYRDGYRNLPVQKLLKQSTLIGELRFTLYGHELTTKLFHT